MAEKTLLLVTVSGQDRPGITAMLTQEIAKENLQLLDIGQSVIFGFLSLSALIDTSCKADSVFLKNMLYECKKRGLNLDYKTLENAPTQSSYKPNSNECYVITCVAKDSLNTLFLAELSQLLANQNFNIQKIDNASSASHLHVVEITVAPQTEKTFPQFKEQVLALANLHQTDLAVVENDLFRFNKRLIVFDMDSTLIEHEVIDELAKHHGCFDQVVQITKDAMQGKLDFSQSLTKRVQLLKGLDEKFFDIVKADIRLTPGTKDCLSTLRSLGFKTAVISGGFKPFTEHVKHLLQLDFDFGNTLEIVNGKLTGNIIGPIIDGKEKANILKHLTMREGIQLKQTVAVGDGSNDLQMLSTAGMGIAFHAKDIVKKKSPHQLSHGPMTSILPMLGIKI